VRGSIVDVFPSTADTPVRVDLWGDEVDRLSEFSVNDQRSNNALEQVLVFPCRELLPTDEVRERADRLIAREPRYLELVRRLPQIPAMLGIDPVLPIPAEPVVSRTGAGRAGSRGPRSGPARR